MGLSFYTGSFTKTTGGAPASQSITGVGFTPKAILMWTAGGLSSGTFVNGHHRAIGMATGAGNERSQAIASQDGVSASNSSARENNNFFSILNWGETLLAACDLISLDADGFTITWDTNNAVGYLIHFLAIGGSDITNAKVLGWTVPNATGNKAVTGAGAKPDFLLHVYTHAITTGTARGNATLGIGATDSAGNQWALSTIDGDNDSPSGNTGRGFLTDHSLFLQDYGPLATGWSATHVSLDSDGFTVNFDVANSQAQKVITLALTGGRHKVGTFTKTTAGAPASQSSPSLGFAPLGYFLCSDQHSSTGQNQAHARMGIGASDGTREQASADTSTQGGSTSDVDAVDKTDKVFVKVNNGSQTIDAEADHSSLDPDSFTLSWSSNDAVATPLGFWAIGAAATPAQPEPWQLRGGMGGMVAQ